MPCSKSNIEYLTHSWNYYTGCKHGLDVCPCSDKCWARGMAHRYNKSFEPTLHTDKLLDPLRLKKPARIGVCFTGDLFGEWVDPVEDLQITQGDNPVYANCSLRWLVKDVMERRPQHDFIFLTKNPSGLLKWGEFPDNAWVGASVCGQNRFASIASEMYRVKAKHKWLSFEPLMGSIGENAGNLLDIMKPAGISWVVIGGWSGGKTQPKIKWVKEIVDAADKAGIPVFLKENLKSLLIPHDNQWAYKYEAGYHLRHEYPVKEIK